MIIYVYIHICIKRLTFEYGLGGFSQESYSWVVRQFCLLDDLLECEAPKIAKLVQISPITMVYGIYSYSYWGLKTNLKLGGLTL